MCRYLSPNQYEVLKDISEGKSLADLMLDKYNSRSIGVLLRYGLIQRKDYTDEAGTLREGWSPSPAGCEAADFYEKRAEEDRKKQEALKAVQAKREQALDKYRWISRKAIIALSAYHAEQQAKDMIIEEVRHIFGWDAEAKKAMDRIDQQIIRDISEQKTSNWK